MIKHIFLSIDKLVKQITDRFDIAKRFYINVSYSKNVTSETKEMATQILVEKFIST